MKEHEVRLLQNEPMRCCNVEVKSVPMKQKEDVMEVINKIAKPLGSKDIEVCRRVRSTGKTDTPNIVMQLARRLVCDSFLDKARKQRIAPDGIKLEQKTPFSMNER